MKWLKKALDKTKEYQIQVAKAVKEEALRLEQAKAKRTEIYHDLNSNLIEFHHCCLLKGEKLVISNVQASSFVLDIIKQDMFGVDCVLYTMYIRSDFTIEVASGVWKDRLKSNIYETVDDFMECFVEKIYPYLHL